MKFLSAIMLVGCAALYAEEIKFNDAAGWAVPGSKEQIVAKDGVFTMKSDELAHSKKIKVDPDGLYKLSVTAKSMADKDAWLMVGYYAYDKNNRQISVVNVANKADSITEVLANAPKGSKSFQVRDASKFNKDLFGRFAIAIDAKDNMSDLPNFRIEYLSVESVQQGKSGWTVNLKQPLPADLRAGIKIRQHYEGGAFYTMNFNAPAGKWFTSEGYNEGISVKGTEPHKFPSGTAFVSIVIVNPGRVPAEIKDVKEVIE